MNEKALVFKVGTHNNRPFDLEKVKKIFSNISNPVKAIYAHTSHWNKLGKEPLEVGEFSNFEIDSEGKVYAELELNEKGLIYKQDNAIKGISVEIPNDNLSRIALLPIGVRPAVEGAEFEEFEMDLIEFELIEKKDEGGKKLLTYEELKKEVEAATLEDRLGLIKVIGLSIPEDQKKAFSAIRWEFEEKTKETVKEFAEFAGVEVEFKEPVKAKTEAEIRKEVEAEYEAKAKINEAKAERERFLEENKTKITPALKSIVEFALEKAQAEEDKIIEFSADEKISMKAKIVKTISEAKGIVLGEISKEQEFEKEETDELIKQARESGRNLNIIGG